MPPLFHSAVYGCESPADAAYLSSALVLTSPRCYGTQAYGDYNTLCPLVFTQAALLQSFPDSTLEPWTMIEEWGPTESGLSGFAVQIPEMDKVVMVRSRPRP